MQSHERFLVLSVFMPPPTQWLEALCVPAVCASVCVPVRPERF